MISAEKVLGIVSQAQRAAAPCCQRVRSRFSRIVVLRWVNLGAVSRLRTRRGDESRMKVTQLCFIFNASDLTDLVDML